MTLVSLGGGVLLPLAGILLVLAASVAVRAPVRLPRPISPVKGEAALRSIHRGIVIHLALFLACAVPLAAGRDLPPAATAAYLLALAVVRVGAAMAGRRKPAWGRMVAPLLAPLDGAALLLDWALSPLFRRVEPTPSPEQAEAFEQVLELTQTTVESVMIPRSRVAWFPAAAGEAEMLETVRARPHSRYPVFRGDVEQLVGIVDLSDLLRPIGARTAGDLAQPAVVVPETMGCDDLLERMRRDGFDAAIVIDEFGGTAGLVTVEDLLEVVVGRLTGEHEPSALRVRRGPRGAWIVDATLRLDEFEERFGVALPEGDYETLAGLFLSHLTHIPEAGEKLDVEDVHLEVLEADERRIRTLGVTFRKAAAKGGAPAGG
ncbi:MAG: hemolysin family protein [Candidatus Eisenbacteria bacterium]